MLAYLLGHPGRRGHAVVDFNPWATKDQILKCPADQCDTLMCTICCITTLVALISDPVIVSGLQLKN